MTAGKTRETRSPTTKHPPPPLQATACVGESGC
jgi:hypothetical protein